MFLIFNSEIIVGTIWNGLKLSSGVGALTLFIQPRDSGLDVLDKVEVLLGRVVDSLDFGDGHETLVCHEGCVFGRSRG